MKWKGINGRKLWRSPRPKLDYRAKERERDQNSPDESVEERETTAYIVPCLGFEVQNISIMAWLPQ
jgi:hypothetical protein